MIGTALAGDPQRYALEAGDGVPGAFRVLIIPGSTGTWACEATWTGRALAGLWVEDGNGNTVRRLVGASPLLLELPIDGQALPIDQKLIVRFAPFTARGPMTGWLTVTAPAQESETNIQTPPAPVSLIEATSLAIIRLASAFA